MESIREGEKGIKKTTVKREGRRRKRRKRHYMSIIHGTICDAHQKLYLWLHIFFSSLITLEGTFMEVRLLYLLIWINLNLKQ